jgi:hypothetical protein
MNYKIINILWFLTVLFCVAALCKYTQAGDGGSGSKIRLWAAILRFTRSHQKSQFN